MDSTHQVIVAARATNATSDKQQAVAMVEETIGNVGAVPREVSADAGYYSVKAVEELYALGANPFIAPEKTRHGRVCGAGAPWPHTQGTVRQGTGCGASCGRNEDVSATPLGWRRLNRCSARSSRAGASGSSCCGVWRR